MSLTKETQNPVNAYGNNLLNSVAKALLSNTNLLVECFYKLDNTISLLRSDVNERAKQKKSAEAGVDDDGKEQKTIVKRNRQKMPFVSDYIHDPELQRKNKVRNLLEISYFSITYFRDR